MKKFNSTANIVLAGVLSASTLAVVPAYADESSPVREGVREGLSSIATALTSRTVFITADGGGTTVAVPLGSTVAETVALGGFELADLDRTSAPREQEIVDKQLIVIDRVVEKQRAERVNEPYTAVADTKLVECEAGESSKMTPGRNGVRVNIYRETMVNGVVESSVLRKSTVTTEPVNEVWNGCLPPAPVPDSAASSAANSVDSEGTVASGVSVPAEAASVRLTEGGVVDEATKKRWLTAAGIPVKDWKIVDWLVKRESNWDHGARNASSGAFGLPQSLPGNKMASAGSDWQTNPVTQLKWQHSYVKGRYAKSANGGDGYQRAYEFWKKNRWY